jgi:hypothetical protein
MGRQLHLEGAKSNKLSKVRTGKLKDSLILPMQFEIVQAQE